MDRLRTILRKQGEWFPKKHGSWYRLHIYDNNYLLYDTWNGKVYHHEECKSSGTDNMYKVVYVFSGLIDSVKQNMVNFWIAHIKSN